MRIAHRAPVADWFAVPESDPVDEDYEAQVGRSTERGEREYRQAQERLTRAEQRLARTRAEKTRSGRKKRLAQLEALVEERRAELAEIARLMAAPVATDRQLIFRTGRDNHLELGEHKRAEPRRLPAGPVIVRTTGAPE